LFKFQVSNPGRPDTVSLGTRQTYGKELWRPEEVKDVVRPSPVVR